jgi:hypothetical protein
LDPNLGTNKRAASSGVEPSTGLLEDLLLFTKSERLTKSCFETNLREPTIDSDVGAVVFLDPTIDRRQSIDAGVCPTLVGDTYAPVVAKVTIGYC